VKQKKGKKMLTKSSLQTPCGGRLFVCLVFFGVVDVVVSLFLFLLDCFYFD